LIEPPHIGIGGGTLMGLDDDHHIDATLPGSAAGSKGFPNCSLDAIAANRVADSTADSHSDS